MKTTTTETSIPEEKTTSARIQAYSKSQLAALYLPHIQPASARRSLRSWIAKNILGCFNDLKTSFLIDPTNFYR